MAKRINTWSLGKTAMLLITATLGPIAILSMEGDFSSPNVGFFFIIAAFGFIGVLFVLGFQEVNPLATDNAKEQILQTYNFGAINIIVLGFSSLIAGILSTPINWAWELPMAFGIGSWLGLRVHKH